MPREPRTRRAGGKLHCRLPIPLYDRLQEEAGRRGTTITAILSDILRDALPPTPLDAPPEDDPGYHDFNGEFEPEMLEDLRSHARRRFTPVRFVVIQAILTHLEATSTGEESYDRAGTQ